MATQEEEKDTEVSENEDLLYDILVYREWPQTSDPRSESVPEISYTSNQSGWFDWVPRLGTSSGLVGCSSDPPQPVLSLLKSRSSWKFALSADGSLMAVVQDNLLEIFSSRDNFANGLSKVRLQRDYQACLRQLEWSPDSSLLVLTSSKGSVDLYDAYGYLVYSIFSQRLPQTSDSSSDSEVSHNNNTNNNYAYASAFFTDLRVKSRDWLCELILVDYSGRINSFLLSPSGYQEFSSFDLSNHYLHGITAVSYSCKHGLLCVAGPLNTTSTSSMAGDEKGPSNYGLTTWRLLNETPHYDLVLPHDHKGFGKRKMSWLPPRYTKLPAQDHIFNLQESPSGTLLCSLHCSGSIRLWRLPGLQLVQHWPLEVQPCHDDMNPTLLSNPRLKKRKKLFLKQPLKWSPLEAQWWNEEAVVVARNSGGVTIIPLKDPDRNLLGESSEFFSAPPSLSRCFGKGFFVLERETSSRRKKKKDEQDEDEDCAVESGESSQSSDEDEEEEEEDQSVYVRGKRAAASLAYMMTESERFAPPRKKAKSLFYTFKLLALISTTPDELYTRKIDSEEYGEALILAQHYNLDSDHVYERQWKLSNLSVTAIKDYLAKIKRRSLVLRECINTVPNDVEAIRDLLHYGLQETDLEVLVLMMSSGESGKFIQAKNHHNYYLTEEEEKVRREQKQQELLNKVEWQNLTVLQKDLLDQRRRLLKYVDRLDTYVAIVESYPHQAYFDRDFYIGFRDKPLLKATVEFARKGNVVAVQTLLRRYNKELKKWQLSILDNFPESLDPDKYRALIPVPFQHRIPPCDETTEKDWIEYEYVKQFLLHDNDGDDEEKDDEEKNMYACEIVTKDLLTKWIHERARQIERESSLVDHSLQLLQLGSEMEGVVIDLRLHHQLVTLEVMMYDMQPQKRTSFSLEEMKEMSDLEVMIKLMEECPKEKFFAHVQKFLVPYLDRLEQLESGSRHFLLHNYLLHLSATSLVLPFELIKSTQNQLKSHVPSVFMSYDECVAFGIDCIFAYEDGDGEEDELIVEFATYLRKKCRNPHVMDELEDILDIMKSVKLLKKYHINKTLHYFKACRADKKAMGDLFQQITRRAEGKKPRLTAREWSEVMQDLFELRRLIHVVPLFHCIEVLCESLLCSEDEDNIRLVQDIFEYSPADALFKGKSAMLYILSVHKIGCVPLSSRVKVVTIACEYYFDSSKDVDDPNLELAKKCLKLVPEKPQELAKYYNLLSALEMLHEFGVSILPIVLRNSDNQQTIVSKILTLDSSAYKNARKILKLVKLIHSVRINADDVLNEAPVLAQIAESALKCQDYDYCLSICDMMMDSSSSEEETCKVCLQLVHCADFTNVPAKARLASYCVNSCTEQQIEDMLQKRISLSDDIVEQLNSPVNVKSSSDKTPRGLHSLFDKLSQFTPKKNRNVEEEEEEELLLEKKSPEHKSKLARVSLNVFYENVFEKKARMSKLHANFETFSNNTNNCNIDKMTLSLLSQHYKSYEEEEEEGLEWPVLKDILFAILDEDSQLGLALLLAELPYRQGLIEDLIGDRKRSPFGLYLASLHAVVKILGYKKEHFLIAPGLLYACAKSLHDHDLLDSDTVMTTALQMADL